MIFMSLTGRKVEEIVLLSCVCFKHVQSRRKNIKVIYQESCSLHFFNVNLHDFLPPSFKCQMLLCLLRTQNCFQWNGSVARDSSPVLIIYILNTRIDFLNAKLNEYCVTPWDKRVIILEHRDVSQTCYLEQWIQLWFTENSIPKIKLNEPSVFTEGAREEERLAVIYIANIVEAFVESLHIH